MVIPTHQILGFSVQIAYLAQNKHSHLALPGVPYCQHATQDRTNRRSEETDNFTTYVASQRGHSTSVTEDTQPV